MKERETLDEVLNWLFEEEPERPIGPCPEAWDVMDWVDDAIEDPEENARLERHILSCPNCLELAERFADFNVYAKTWRGRRELARIKKRLLKRLGLWPSIWNTLEQYIGIFMRALRGVIFHLTEISHDFKGIPFPSVVQIRGEEKTYYTFEDSRLKRWGYMPEYEVFVSPGEDGYIRLRFFQHPKASRCLDLFVQLYIGKVRVRSAKTQRVSHNEYWVFFDDLLISSSNWEAFSYRASPVKR